MYSNILVPVDLAHAEIAGKMITAAEEMIRKDGKLTLLHVLPDLPSIVAANLPEGTVELSKTHAVQELDSILAGSGVKHEVATLVRIGSPHYGILEAAEEIGADLIVIASHKPELADYLLGSTAAKVVRHAKSSVHVMR